MCHNVEKPRTNAIKTMASLWSSPTSSVATVRLFLDFRVPQKVVHCFHVQGARCEAASFIVQSLNASKVKAFDPMYVLLRRAINSPAVLLHCSLIVRNTRNETLRPVCLEILKNVMYGESPGDVQALIASDNIWTLSDFMRDSQVLPIIGGAAAQSSAFFAEVLLASTPLQRQLEAAGVVIAPIYDPKAFDDNLDIRESLTLLKKVVASTTLIREPDMGLVGRSVEYFKKLVHMIVRESDSVGKFMETQAMKATRFDAKESAFMKAQNKSKETAAAVTHSLISEMCRVFVCFFKKLATRFIPHCPIRKDLLNLFIEIAQNPIPACRPIPHPVVLLHQAIQRMFIFAMTGLHSHHPLRQVIRCKLPDLLIIIWKRDIDYALYCASKETTQAQLLVRYETDRLLRWKFVEIFFNQQLEGFPEILQFVLQDMIHSPAQLKVDAFPYLKYLEFPARSEAIEIVEYILHSREKIGGVGQELIKQMVAMKFVEKERKMTDLNDRIHLIESSMDLLQTILTCETEFPPGFIQEAQVQLESLKIRFEGEWNPIVVKLVDPGEPRQPVIRALISRSFTSQSKSRSTVPLLLKRTTPKIATVKSGAIRAATSFGARK
jgi:hypothetical protein